MEARLEIASLKIDYSIVPKGEYIRDATIPSDASKTGLRQNWVLQVSVYLIHDPDLNSHPPN